MKEIVTVQIGQCGNQIGWRFWDCVNNEHASHPDSDAKGTFFCRTRSGETRARALLVDMEEGVVSQLRRSRLGHLFHESMTITDVSGCGNNWAVGYSDYGPQYGPDVVDGVRRLLEACESPQSLQLMHSVGGGTGSGLGSWVLEHLAMEFPELYRLTTSVLPAAVDDVVTSPYNAVLTLAQLREHADCVFAVENDALAGHPIVKEYQAGLNPGVRQGRPAAGLKAPGGGGGGGGATGGAPAAAPSPSPSVDSALLAALQQADQALAKAQGVGGRSAGPSTAPSAAAGSAAGRKPAATSQSAAASGKPAGRPSGIAAPSAVARQAPGRSGPGRPVGAQGRRPAEPAQGSAAGAAARSSSAGSAAGGDRAGPAPSKSVKQGQEEGEGATGAEQSRAPAAVSSPRPRGSAFDGMNEVVARMLADMTASVRFPGSLNVDLNEIATTLVPFPKLQFLTTGLAMAPHSLRPGAPAGPMEDVVEGLVASTFAKKSALITADLAREKHVAVACLLRGTDSIAALTDTMGRLRKDLKVVQWNQHGYKSGLCSVPPPWARATALTISNNVCVRTPLARSYDRFLKLYRARAHLHHYLEYLDAGDIVQAAHGVVGTVQAYEEMAGQG